MSQQAEDKQITIVPPENDFEVESDPTRVKQVVLNLLTNAIKYNKPGGNIYVLIQPHESATDPHPMLEIAVKDTGYGIPEKHQKNMFQKFYRVPTLMDVERGTGLGLAICKNIVEAHGGRIWLDSQEDVGSTFFFTIPLHVKE